MIKFNRRPSGFSCRRAARAGLITVSLMLGASGSVLALDPMPLNDEGPVRIVPTLGLAYGYDDNVERAPDDQAVGRQVVRATPNLSVVARERANVYRLEYNPELLFYGGDRYGNRVNHNATGIGEVVFNARNRATVNGQATRNKAPLDDTNRANDEADGDINERLLLDGTYSYGAQGARGELRFTLGYIWNRYANNLSVQGSNKQSEEYNSPFGDVTFLWRVAPKTRALAEVSYEDYRYIWSQSTLDSHNLNTSVGLSWEATAKTTGEFRVGRERKSFDDPAKTDQTITSWQANIIWQPASYSSIRLTTNSSLNEGSESADNVTRESTKRNRSYGVAWNHQWNSRLGTEVGYRRTNNHFIASAGTNVGRVDRTNEVNVGVTYAFRRWLDIGLTTTRRDKDASIGPASSYRQNVYFLAFEVSL